MKVVYNGKVLNESEVSIKISDRSFLYGDGFFETLFCTENICPYLDKHYNRITSAFKVFNFDTKALPSLEGISESISTTNSLNGLNNARVKIIFWREVGGLYNTPNTSFNYLITFSTLDSFKTNNKTAVYQKKGTNTYCDFSPFKPLSAFKYIHAGIELQNTGFDDIIILSDAGNISEGLYSNLFWCTNGIYFTPKLTTGCINGIMRNNIIDYLISNNFQIIEIEANKVDLLNANYVFSCNSLGIQSITQIENKKYSESPLVKELTTVLLTQYFN